MLTTCPECQTRFRVGHPQLGAKRGLVRCGQCRAVFNAYDTLLPELETPTVIGPQSQALSAPDSGPDVEAAAIETIELRATDWPEPDVVEADPYRVEPTAQVSPAARAEPGQAEVPREAVGDAAPAVSTFTWTLPEPVETPDSILLSELPQRRPFPWAAIGRGLFGVLLLFVLAVQAAYFLRGELAARYPVTRAYLELACAPFGCTVPLPRERGLLQVDASGLETDPEHPARARLRVAFSNRADQTLAWPDLVLTLTDVRDTAVAQRVFRPADYLPPQRIGLPGLPARDQIEVVLDLDLGRLSAAGYRVRLDYF